MPSVNRFSKSDQSITPGGARGLVVEGDPHTALIPPVNQGLLVGQLAWRQYGGGHTDAPNMKWFIQWADKFIGHTPPQ